MGKNKGYGQHIKRNGNNLTGVVEFDSNKINDVLFLFREYNVTRNPNFPSGPHKGTRRITCGIKYPTHFNKALGTALEDLKQKHPDILSYQLNTGHYEPLI